MEILRQPLLFLHIKTIFFAEQETRNGDKN